MNKGTVKFFNDAKGFGFIKGENEQDIFVHATGLNEDIRENDNVTYDTENGKNGLNAVNLRIAEQYLMAFAGLAKTNNTMILPSNLSDIAGIVATATSVFNETKDKKKA